MAYSYYVVGYVSPVGLLGTMYALESLGSREADGMVERVRRVLGIGQEGTSFLAEHGGPDAGHIAEIERVLDQVTAPSERALIEHVAGVVYALYATMLRDVWTSCLAGPPLPMRR